MLGMSEARVKPESESMGCSAPMVPNFGIHGSSIMQRSYEEPFAWKVVTSFSKSWSYGNSTISIVMPVCDWYIGATFLSGPSSAPCTAAITSFDGLLVPLLDVVHASRMAGNDVNTAPATAVRFTNSRLVIRCIPTPFEVEPAINQEGLRRLFGAES